jgi:hypothetical protein
MSMLLKSDDGNEFELALVEDRFPEVQDGGDDSAYTTITFRINTPDESWEETAPCIDLFELTNLREWLDAVARRGADVAEIEMVEPELRFSVSADSGDEVTVRIGFSAEEDRGSELAPPVGETGTGRAATPSSGRAEPDGPCVDIRLPREKLAAAAAELERDIQHATAAGPKAQRDAEDDSGIIGVPDEALNLIDEDRPLTEETDPDRML